MGVAAVSGAAPLLRRNRVVGERRVEAVAGDGQRGRVDGQVEAGGGVGHDGRDVGHADCRAAGAVGGDDGVQGAAGGGRRELTVSVFALAPVTMPQPRRRPLAAEGDGVMGGDGVEAGAADGERGRVGKQAGPVPVTAGVTVATCTGVPLDRPSVATMAVRLPAVEVSKNVTVSVDGFIPVPAAAPS